MVPDIACWGRCKHFIFVLAARPICLPALVVVADSLMTNRPLGESTLAPTYSRRVSNVSPLMCLLQRRSSQRIIFLVLTLVIASQEICCSTNYLDTKMHRSPHLFSNGQLLLALRAPAVSYWCPFRHSSMISSTILVFMMYGVVRDQRLCEPNRADRCERHAGARMQALSRNAKRWLTCSKTTSWTMKPGLSTTIPGVQVSTKRCLDWDPFA